MFILDSDKKCMKQKNYKDLEIAVKDFINENNVNNSDLSNESETFELASIIEVIYKDIYCSSEDNSDLTSLIYKMMIALKSVEPPVYNDSDLEYFKLKINKLSKLPQPEQRTPEWYEYRNNRLTASDLWYVINENEAKILDILKKKCGIEQKYNLGPALLHGIKFEPVATRIYELRNNVSIIEFGCLPHQFIPYFGASPDGICGCDSINKNYVGRMLEIKCPKSRVITGFIPEVYQGQIQGQLEVCDLDYCDFLECDFRIYLSKEDYLKDYSNNYDIDYNKTKNGMEKGVIFEIYNTITKSYEYKYSDTNFKSVEEIDAWEEPFIDTILESDHLEHAGTTFWYLNLFSTVLVKRDKEWFSNNFYKIKNFWESVEYARINGIPEKKKKSKDKSLENNSQYKQIDMSQFIGSEQLNKPNEFILDFDNSGSNSSSNSSSN